MAAYYVGLDVHSRLTAFTVQDEEGKTVAQGSVATGIEGLTSLRERFSLPTGTSVGLESGTQAFYMARLLERLELQPVIIDAREVRIKAHRPTQKSDRRDAREICEGLRRGIYRCLVHVPSESIVALRESLGRRRHFVRVQTAEVNAAKRLLRATGFESLSRRVWRNEVTWERVLEALRCDPELRAHVDRHRAVWSTARAQVLALEELLEQQGAPFREEVELLQTVPWVGRIVALTAVAVFSDAQRFAAAKRAASYAGLVPSTYQSGERDAHGRITRRGSGELRAMLCEAAHHARRPDHPLHPYFRSLCARRGYRMAVVAVAHRLCRILWAMLRHRTAFDATKLGIEVGPFERSFTQHYRLRRSPRG